MVDPAVPATCETAGKTEGKHCSVCNKVLVEQEEVSTTEHKMVNGVCEVCGDTETTGGESTSTEETETDPGTDPGTDAGTDPETGTETEPEPEPETGSGE